MIDTAQIIVKAGNGGDGHVSFHRAKYVPKGGPDGGDGGNGGNIVFHSTKKLNTLSLFHRKKRYEAKAGEDGMKNKKHGRNGEDFIINIPIGTQVKSEDGKFSYDFTKEESVTIATGGNGGIGNVHFKSSTNQTPLQSTKGTEGQTLELSIELKILADIGIIGLPSSGKSTLLNALTNSQAKTASYHFTTLEPNLGVLSRNGKEIVLADIPGLIEGASEGRGLGHDFLRHIERTNLLIHILDGMEGILDVKKIVENYKVIRNELKQWEENLLKKKEIVVINKTDITEVKDTKGKITEAFKKLNITPLFISAITMDGLDTLVNEIYREHNLHEKTVNLTSEEEVKTQKTTLVNLNTVPNRRIVFRKTNHGYKLKKQKQ